MPSAEKQTKGRRTAERILDAAEALFAERGYEAGSLREIARRAGIQQPGLYNHFASKQQLYAAVLDRALTPMTDAMSDHFRNAAPRDALTQLPAVMTDLLLEHPKLAALFQQALQGDGESVGNQLMRGWLDRLLTQGFEALDTVAGKGADRTDVALEVIAMFNLTTGYFLSQRALASMVEGDIADPRTIARQKKLLARLAGAMQAG
jgi:AcrR family transcriptional regulator